MLVGIFGSVGLLLASIFPNVQSTSPFYAAPAFMLLVLARCGTALAAAHRVTGVDSIRALR